MYRSFLRCNPAAGILVPLGAAGPTSQSPLSKCYLTLPDMLRRDFFPGSFLSLDNSDSKLKDGCTVVFLNLNFHYCF
jgi:hypothetical protein